MSETADVRRSTVSINGMDTELFRAEFGTGRSVTVRRLDMGDQYDIAELMGADASPTWVSMTLLAASVNEIDGKPSPTARTKATFRQILKQLGEGGVEAARRALDAATEAEGALKRDVGNFSAPEPSGA